MNSHDREQPTMVIKNYNSCSNNKLSFSAPNTSNSNNSSNNKLNSSRKTIMISENYKQLDVIEICSSNIKNSVVRLLLDTGADVSLLKAGRIEDDSVINKEIIVELKGISEQPIYTLGTCFISIKLENEKTLKHEFHVISDSKSIKNDGLLGRDFLQKYKAKIDYEKESVNFENNHFKLLPSETFVIIPARCETIISALANMPDAEGIVKPKQISDKLYLGTTLTKVKNYKCFVSILNISDEDFTKTMPRVSVEPFIQNNVDITEINSMSQLERLEKLKKSLNLEGLNNEETNSLLEACNLYNDIFHLDGDKLSCTNTVQHNIPTDPSKGPINTKPYRLPFKHREIIKEQTDQMLNDGIISPSCSPWNSPLLVVPKKSDPSGEPKYRVCVDLRKINDITTGADAFPLPNITDILDQLGQAQYFTTLDLANGFHQVKLDDNDKLKTAFSTQTGHYVFNRMPFGLKGAPATFQRLMNTVLSGLNGLKCFIYLDDIVIYANNLTEHNHRLTEAFQRFRQHNLKLQPSKCSFLRKECLYLGHIITENGIKPDPAKVDCVSGFPQPKNAKDIKSFLGLVGYYRKFIQDFAKIAKPLTKLLKKDEKFLWNNECGISFETLKKSIISPPVLQYPDFSKEFIITTDASNYAIGAILSQGKINSDRPIAFASRTLNKAERNYSTTEKELAAIVWAVKHFRPYVFGTKFKIVTDHKPLLYVFNIKDPGSRLTRFRLKLEEYNFEVIYKAGKKNINADALSRIVNTVNTINTNLITDYTEFQSYLQTHIILNSKIKEKNTTLFQTNDTDPLILFIPKNFNKGKFRDLENNKQANKFMEGFNKATELNVISVHHYQDPDMFLLVDNENTFSDANYENIWYCLLELRNLIRNTKVKLSLIKYHYNPLIKWDIIYPMLRYLFQNLDIEITIYNNNLISPSESDKNTILEEFHNSPIAGHQGVSRTYKKLANLYNWRGMKKDLKRYIKKCEFCQKNKLSRKTKMPMVITTTATKPFERCFLDVVGPLPETESGNKYILTFQDDLTKFNLNIPMKDQEAATVAEHFVKNIICYYGIPEILVTDRGTNFLSELFKNTCKMLKIKKIQTTSYHPESNGALERSHRSLEEYLRHFISDTQEDWDNWIPFATFTYNTSTHTATQFAPFELLFGYSPTLPTSITQSPKTSYTYEDFVANLKQKMQYSRQIARENLLDSKYKSKNNYDKNSLSRDFTTGDKVLLYDESVRRGRSKKLTSLWIGPYTIVEKLSDVNYVIQKGNKKQTVHANRLKHFHD